MQAKVAVFFVEALHLLRRHGGKGGVGHIHQMPVLILAVHAVQPGAVHPLIAGVQILVLAVGVIGIPEVELQRVVIILAKIHQHIHLLAGKRMLGYHVALPVHHAGTVAGNGVVVSDAAQLVFVPDARVGAAGAEHEFTPGSLQLFYRLYHRRAGLCFSKGHQRVIVIACQNLILHGHLSCVHRFLPV